MKESKKERAMRKKAQTIKNNLVKKQKRSELKKIADEIEYQRDIKRKEHISSFNGQRMAFATTSLTLEDIVIPLSCSLLFKHFLEKN